MTAYNEPVWSRNVGLKSHGNDWQWGGGSLFVSDAEKNDVKTGKNSNTCHSEITAGNIC